MAEKAKFTVGVFAGIIRRRDGKLLLRRRTETGSIIPGMEFKGCWELPGGGVMETQKVPYCHLAAELLRELTEELGVHVVGIHKMPAFYPMSFKGSAGYDLALVTAILVENLNPACEHVWVSTGELNQLAKDFVAADKKTGASGDGLLSGWGKRMHCMALACLAHSSTSSDYASLAEATLRELMSHWIG